jgi:hypothetical protein
LQSTGSFLGLTGEKSAFGFGVFFLCGLAAPQVALRFVLLQYGFGPGRQILIDG